MMTRRLINRRAVLTSLAGVVAVACGGKKKIGPAPDEFKVNFETSKGPIVLQVHKSWAPRGVDRFYELCKIGFYDQDRFFRVVKGFVVQFGINGDTKVNKDWAQLQFLDDPVKVGNKRGTVTFATSGPNSRSTQLFINLADNSRLDEQGFAPFAEVVQGMDVVDQFYAAYGEGPPDGEGPDQATLADNGNDYLEHYFPKLDYIKRTHVIVAK